MRNNEDRPLHKGLRNKLINHIREKGITDENVLQSMLNVPRHFFLDSAFEQQAYEDRPYTVAYQSQLLQIKPFDKVLEVGTGSAYQATVLCELQAKVFSIERQKKLFDANKEFQFLKQYPTLRMFFGDGFEGLPTYAPFDKVLITAAAPFVPEKLLAQLKIGGCMVLPLNEGEIQRMHRITKMSDGSFEEEKFDEFSFVPMLLGKRR